MALKLKSVTLNLSNKCNFMCIGCLQSYHLGHYDNPSLKTAEFLKLQKGFMNERTILNFLKSIKEWNIDSCSLAWTGETLMHPNFIKFYNLLCKNNLNKIHIKRWNLDTNASFLNPDLNKKIIEITNKYHQALTITLSLNAINQKTFNKISSSNESIQKINLNCKNFILKQNNSRNITVVIKSLIFKENLNEMFEFYKYWKNFFKSNLINYKVIFSQGKREEGIYNYIFFSKISPEKIGQRLWDEFKKIRELIKELEK